MATPLPVMPFDFSVLAGLALNLFGTLLVAIAPVGILIALTRMGLAWLTNAFNGHVPTAEDENKRYQEWLVTRYEGALHGKTDEELGTPDDILARIKIERRKRWQEAHREAKRRMGLLEGEPKRRTRRRRKQDFIESLFA